MESMAAMNTRSRDEYSRRKKDGIFRRRNQKIGLWIDAPAAKGRTN